MVTSTDCIKKYGIPYDNPDTSPNENMLFESRWMTLWDVPANLEIGAIPKKIYCNKDLVAPLEQAFKNLIDRKKVEELKTWGGCFNIRNKRGLSTLSLHSWGIAIDVNAAWNGLGREPQLSPEFVKCFTDAGFEWGGTWGRKDGMHFQLAKI